MSQDALQSSHSQFLTVVDLIFENIVQPLQKQRVILRYILTLCNLVLQQPLTVMLYITPYLAPSFSAVYWESMLHNTKVEAQDESLLRIRS